MITLQEIAKLAGVSVATVSHVINHTRYVSPELKEKVERIIEENGYNKKLEKQKSNWKVGRQSTIDVVVPGLQGTLYARLITSMNQYLKDKGYFMSVHFTDEDREQEQHILNELMNSKKTAGIILVPAVSDAKAYAKVISRKIPFLFLEHAVEQKEISTIVSDNENAIYMAACHLLQYGHMKIALLVSNQEKSLKGERWQGYVKALREHDVEYMDSLVIEVPRVTEDACKEQIRRQYDEQKPTAYIAGGNRLTMYLLSALQEMGVEFPGEVSVVGFGDEEWCELVNPPLTTVKQETEQMGYQAVEEILRQIMHPQESTIQLRIPAKLEVRKSTQMIGRGPFGEAAVSADELLFSEEEICQLKEGDYKVGISFHYGGTAWARLHENGIRHTLEKYGIAVISVSDAHFDPDLQVTQLEGLRMMKPDAVIAIPADDEVTAQEFKRLAKTTKLIFLSSVPRGILEEEYASCVSVNERENGHNAGMLMGEYFKDKGRIKAGFIKHGASFHGTHLRDGVAEQVVREHYPNIDIIDTRYFRQIPDAYGLCRDMLLENPQIQALYISWDVPALEAIRAIHELGREDIDIFTFDLDLEITKYLARGEMVRGLSTQRPYEQGVAAAKAVAKALLNKGGFKYIGVQPSTVERKNLLKSWKEINHEAPPEELKAIIVENYVK